MFKLAVDNINNWVFVTGAIRSGTTFVGQILSLPREVDFINEPFNPLSGMPGIKRWYPYLRPSLDTEEMKYYHELSKNIFTYDLKLKNWYPDSDPLTKKISKTLLGNRGVFYLRLAKPNIFHNTAIIKDPTGNLLTEYFYQQFKVKPVILIKHPLSFIASLQRVNWPIKHNWILNQTALVDDYFANDLKFVDREYEEPILAAAAYWRALHKVLLSQLERYPDWQMITHEELCREPISVFKKLYQALNLPWSNSIQQKIIKLTQGSTSAEAKKGTVHDFNRNSAEIFKMRRDSISKEHRQAVFEIVKDVALDLYPQESFAID